MTANGNSANALAFSLYEVFDKDRAYARKDKENMDFLEEMMPYMTFQAWGRGKHRPEDDSEFGSHAALTAYLRGE